MNADEFLLNELNSCILVKDISAKLVTNVDSIYWITSPQIIRQRKLCRITNSDFNYVPSKDKNIKCLFEMIYYKKFYIDSSIFKILINDYKIENIYSFLVGFLYTHNFSKDIKYYAVLDMHIYKFSKNIEIINL